MCLTVLRVLGNLGILDFEVLTADLCELELLDSLTASLTFLDTRDGVAPSGSGVLSEVGSIAYKSPDKETIDFDLYEKLGLTHSSLTEWMAYAHLDTEVLAGLPLYVF